MVYIWFIYGLYMVYIWLIYGLYMVSIWIIMDNLWYKLYLVGGWQNKTPLKKIWVKVNWDDEIPNGKIKLMFQTTNQLYHVCCMQIIYTKQWSADAKDRQVLLGYRQVFIRLLVNPFSEWFNHCKWGDMGQKLVQWQANDRSWSESYIRSNPKPKTIRNTWALSGFAHIWVPLMPHESWEPLYVKICHTKTTQATA